MKASVNKLLNAIEELMEDHNGSATERGELIMEIAAESGDDSILEEFLSWFE